VGTGSFELVAEKSPIVPGEVGLVTPIMSRLTESPALIESASGIVAVPLVSTAPVATNRQFWVVSITSIPVTLEKFVGPAGSVR
jgi:hypothetical protein